MVNLEHLVEQRILEYESRLKHVDELTWRADDAAKEQGLDKELRELIKERDRLASHVERMKLRSLEEWDKEELAQAGPMGVWDALAQQLEKLIERSGR